MVILCATLPARANLLTDPSFEDNSIGTIIGGGAPFFFTRTWEIDLGKIVGTENGIVPLDGDQMLLFDTPPPSLSTDIYQLVNVSGSAAAIAAQTATLELSAFFNATMAHGFHLTLLSFEADGVEEPIFINAFDGILQSALSFSDADVETWEEFTLRWVIPQDTHFIAAGLNSQVGGGDAFGLSDFSYADKISLTLSSEPAPIPEPATMLLFGAGALGVLGRTRRRHRSRTQSCG